MIPLPGEKYDGAVEIRRPRQKEAFNRFMNGSNRQNRVRRPVVSRSELAQAVFGLHPCARLRRGLC